MAFEIDEGTRNTIERILGRSIATQRGDLAGYNEIADADLDDLRRLWSSGGVITATYLLHRLDGRGGLQSAKMYIHHVIGTGDMTASQWLEQSSTLE
ncbi:hypothetical protein ACSFBF_14235 [Variovorax sp. ZT5P49]|uniref:hypothetical protein n=1 Tax=Variovorax sp. ZT5P49 TaxID=3443733 RepID=UPI003F490520